MHVQNLVCIPISFTKKNLWKAFWLLVLLVTTIGFALQAYTLIIGYLKYEKSTTIRVSIPNPIYHNIGQQGGGEPR